MTYIFWQNILSIHQSAFIRNLANEDKVILVVEEGLNKERISHGWNVPDFGNTDILINPDDKNISTLLSQKDAIHIFTGIKSFKMVYKVFKRAIKNKCKILIQSEPYNYTDSKAWLRNIKYTLLNFKYGKHIDGILAISSSARMCYEKAGFSKDKIYNWAYFTETPSAEQFVSVQNEGIKILFVGSIDIRKNILSILPVIKKHQNKIDKFRIIGKGALEQELLNYTNEKIIYEGAVPNSEISNYFLEADLLILPSIFDGWGAVINESLMLGTPVLCSDTCGASDLIDEDRGYIFGIQKENFEEIYLKTLDTETVSIAKRENIARWAEENISGRAAVKYFREITLAIYKKNPRPNIPWKK